MRFISFLIIALIFLGCIKDNFTTTPQLKFKSVNTTTVSGSQEIVIRLTLTDKEGDFTRFLGFKKTVASCPASNKIDSSFFTIPADFISAKLKEGDVVVTLNQTNRLANFCTLPGGAKKPDTTVFSFWTKDKAGHVSDTARTPTIVILN